MKPDKNTKFKQLSEIDNYKDYCCTAIVFSPETENNHFKGCPPYIELINDDNFDEVYFEIPKFIAECAVIHMGFTIEGRKKHENDGYKKCQNDIKRILGVK